MALRLPRRSWLTRTRWTSGRLKALFYKQGSQGGCGLDSESGKGFEWRAYEDEVVDTTGAGDAFAGGTLTGLLDGESPDIALQRGIVSASFAIEAVGAEALLTTTREAANQRLQEWFRN